MDRSDNSGPPAFMPIRSALILVIALVIGLVVGGLTFWADPSVPRTLLAGLGAAGVALLPLHKLIGR